MQRRLAVTDRTKLNLSEVTVLVAGGSTIETDMLGQMFSGFGAGRLLRAQDPQQLKDHIEFETVDLTVMDQAMGGMACRDAVGWIRRRLGDNRFAPVMLVTANATEATVAEARDAGFDYLVAKPLTPRVLFERLLWLVKEKRRFVESEGYVGPDRRFRNCGPPEGEAGRRHDDLVGELGAAATPNLSQNDIDAMFAPRPL